MGAGAAKARSPKVEGYKELSEWEQTAAELKHFSTVAKTCSSGVNRRLWLTSDFCRRIQCETGCKFHTTSD